MQTTQPINTRHPRRLILSFKATPAPQTPARLEAAYEPQHDFLMPNLCPQLMPDFAPPATRPPRDQARAA
ncbi:MAG: hypothetical protein H7343_22905 [Undibacterium sp.]|nr:hypothetical protein [Opitutaceae bacterium]